MNLESCFVSVSFVVVNTVESAKPKEEHSRQSRFGCDIHHVATFVSVFVSPYLLLLRHLTFFDPRSVGVSSSTCSSAPARAPKAPLPLDRWSHAVSFLVPRSLSRCPSSPPQFALNPARPQAIEALHLVLPPSSNSLDIGPACVLLYNWPTCQLAGQLGFLVSKE